MQSNSGCVVTSGTYKCGVCHRKFPTEQILKEHRSRAHLEKGKHVCKNCQATFSSLNSKRRHTLICFGLAEQIICLKCGRTFSSNWNLKRHCQLLHERKKEPKRQQIKTCKFCSFNCKESHMMVKHLKGGCVLFVWSTKKSFVFYRVTQREHNVSDLLQNIHADVQQKSTFIENAHGRRKGTVNEKNRM